MILSFHPLFEADRNIICAGRQPDTSDLSAIQAAHAVVLSQGCSRELYEMVRQHDVPVFPNYDARFKYPGKIGQAHLFQKLKTPHPKTIVCRTSDEFYRLAGRSGLPPGLPFPFVLKYDWGGEGSTVFLISSPAELSAQLEQAALFERSGQTGFLVQEYIPAGNRVLRVTVIGDTIISYWRVQKEKGRFGASVSNGAMIDRCADPDLQETAVKAVRDFSRRVRINLAGFDLLFSTDPDERKLFFLEINYFFGRRGLGGSEPYYEMLMAEIEKWINRVHP